MTQLVLLAHLTGLVFQMTNRPVLRKRRYLVDSAEASRVTQSPSERAAQSGGVEAGTT